MTALSKNVRVDRTDTVGQRFQAILHHKVGMTFSSEDVRVNQSVSEIDQRTASEDFRWERASEFINGFDVQRVVLGVYPGHQLAFCGEFDLKVESPSINCFASRSIICVMSQSGQPTVRLPLSIFGHVLSIAS